jgi:hypothetical protein
MALFSRFKNLRNIATGNRFFEVVQKLFKKNSNNY